MVTLRRTSSENSDFIQLIKLLDADLAIRDGEDHAFYAQFNTLDHIKNVEIAYGNSSAIGCGAIKMYNHETMEVKRMFTRQENRQEGVGSMILGELEQWTKELGFKRCILETGLQQPEAIALYKKNNYLQIENYGPYIGVENSVCFEKLLR